MRIRVDPDNAANEVDLDERTEWRACQACGSMVRHDDGICIRDKRHPRYDVRRGGGLFPHLSHSTSGDPLAAYGDEGPDHPARVAGIA